MAAQLIYRDQLDIALLILGLRVTAKFRPSLSSFCSKQCCSGANVPALAENMNA